MRGLFIRSLVHVVAFWSALFNSNFTVDIGKDVAYKICFMTKPEKLQGIDVLQIKRYVPEGFGVLNYETLYGVEVLHCIRIEDDSKDNSKKA